MFRNAFAIFVGFRCATGISSWLVRILLGQKMLNVEEICLFIHFRFKTPKFEIWISLNSTLNIPKKQFGNLCRNNGLTKGISVYHLLSNSGYSCLSKACPFAFKTNRFFFAERNRSSSSDACCPRTRQVGCFWWLLRYKAKIVKNDTRKEKTRSWIRYTCIICIFEWVLGG